MNRRSFFKPARPRWRCPPREPGPWNLPALTGQRVGSDWLRLVRQVRPLPPDPGRAGGGCFTL